MKKRILAAAAAAVLGFSSVGHAIVFGEEDSSNVYSNVASLRGIKVDNETPRTSCTGSLLYMDSKKIVFLTAAHCTDAWSADIASGISKAVGVSLDQTNSRTDIKNYIRDGVPISLPKNKGLVQELDYGLVVFPINAKNINDETFEDRWHISNIPPVTVAPNMDYLQNVIDNVSNPQKNLFFTATGYGYGDVFPVPGQETGPATPTHPNFSTFPVRYVADKLSFNAYAPNTHVLQLSQNIAKDENGTCSGDSGAPIFYLDQDLGKIVVAVVSSGDIPCRATTNGPAFSDKAAFDFIDCAKVSGDANAVKSCVISKFPSGVIIHN